MDLQAACEGKTKAHYQELIQDMVLHFLAEESIVNYTWGITYAVALNFYQQGHHMAKKDEVSRMDAFVKNFVGGAEVVFSSISNDVLYHKALHPFGIRRITEITLNADPAGRVGTRMKGMPAGMKVVDIIR